MAIAIQLFKRNLKIMIKETNNLDCLTSEFEGVKNESLNNTSTNSLSWSETIKSLINTPEQKAKRESEQNDKIILLSELMKQSFISNDIALKKLI